MENREAIICLNYIKRFSDKEKKMLWLYANKRTPRYIHKELRMPEKSVIQILGQVSSLILGPRNKARFPTLLQEVGLDKVPPEKWTSFSETKLKEIYAEEEGSGEK